MEGRDFAAQALNQAFNASIRANLTRPYAKEDVQMACAMEGVGVAEALQNYHALSTTTRRIPFTNVRCDAVHVHAPPATRRLSMLARDAVSPATQLSMQSSRGLGERCGVQAKGCPVITRYDALVRERRAMSNPDMVPVQEEGDSGRWVKQGDFSSNFAGGYAYAIASGATNVMSLYQARCNALVRAGHLPATTKCSFTVAYAPPPAPPSPPSAA